MLFIFHLFIYLISFISFIFIHLISPTLIWHLSYLNPNLNMSVIIEFCIPNDPQSMLRMTLMQHFHLVTLLDLILTLA